MSIKKEAFKNYRLGEPDPIREGKVFTVRLNPKEYHELLGVMDVLHISNHSTALKELAFMGKNVILTLFKPETLRWLTDGTRRVDDSKLGKLIAKKDENVIQKEAIL